MTSLNWCGILPKTQSLREDDVYRYLRVLEADEIKREDMKKVKTGIQKKSKESATVQTEQRKYDKGNQHCSITIKIDSSF